MTLSLVPSVSVWQSDGRPRRRFWRLELDVASDRKEIHSGRRCVRL